MPRCRASDWKEQVWVGKLSVVTKGGHVAIKLTGEDGKVRVCDNHLYLLHSCVANRCSSGAMYPTVVETGFSTA